MVLLPVIERELRGRARQGATYWARYGAAAIAIIFALHFTSTINSRPGVVGAGASTFVSLSWIGLLAACASFVATADSISAERRDGTLGLLFLTGLQAYDIVSSKLVAAGLTALFSMIGAMPALALAVLWGGVTGGQIARTALSLMAILFLSLTSGLFVSTRAGQQGEAFRRTGLMMAGLLVAPWIVAGMLSPFGRWSWGLRALSPYRSFQMASAVAYTAAPFQYWFGLAITIAEGCLFFFAAARLLRGAWSELEKRPPIDWRRWLPKWRSKPPVIRPIPVVRQRTWLLDKDPICWLSLRLHDQSTLIWVGALLMIFSGSATSVLFFTGIGAGVSLFASFVPGIIFAWAAGKFFLEARRTGELELLLSTPLGGRDIVRGRWNALLIRFRGPLLLAGFAMFLEFIFTASIGRPALSRAMIPLNRVLDAIAVFWVARWFGLSAKRPLAVIAWPVGLVIALPWFICYALFGWSSVSAFVLLAKNVIFIRWAADKLRDEFRTVAPLAVGSWFKQPEELLQQ